MAIIVCIAINPPVLLLAIFLAHALSAPVMWLWEKRKPQTAIAKASKKDSKKTQDD